MENVVPGPTLGKQCVQSPVCAAWQACGRRAQAFSAVPRPSAQCPGQGGFRLRHSSAEGMALPAMSASPPVLPRDPDRPWGPRGAGATLPAPGSNDSQEMPHRPRVPTPAVPRSVGELHACYQVAGMKHLRFSDLVCAPLMEQVSRRWHHASCVPARFRGLLTREAISTATAHTSPEKGLPGFSGLGRDRPV